LEGEKIMIKKTLLIGFCISILLLLQFPVSAIQENIPINDPFEDPDGPLEGGLDDISDWNYLLDAGFFIYTIVKGLKDKTLFNSGSLRVFIGVLSAYGLFTLDTGLYLGEAFDLIEIDGDGC